MPTNRTRVRRRVDAHLTGEVVDAFEQAVPLNERHRASITEGSDFSEDDRGEIGRLLHIVNTGLNVRPWEISPMDAEGGPCPWCGPQEDDAECSHKPRRAMELRRELEEAAKQ